MKCPHCEHVSDNKVLLRCSKCGETFERGVIEELAHLDYLQSWLEKYASELATSSLDSIREKVLGRKDELLKIIRPPMEEMLQPAVVVESPLSKPKPVIEPLPEPVKAPVPIPETKVQAAPPVAAKPVTVARPAPALKPAAPPKPQRPPIDWNKVRKQIADAATSGALLRALLYLSAFMIVVSATVLVIRFWDNFSAVVRDKTFGERYDQRTGRPGAGNNLSNNSGCSFYWSDR